MPKPDPVPQGKLGGPPPSGEIHLRRLVVTAGLNRVELDGDLTLNSPAVQDLIAKVFAPPSDPVLQKLTSDLKHETDALAGSVAANQP